MPPVIWSPAARLDLRRIERWLVENRTPEIAADALTAIRTRADFLMSFPHGGRPLTGELRLLRVLGTGYLIVYQLAAVPEVVRIHHEREDWQVLV